jgi:hypothetical protein
VALSLKLSLGKTSAGEFAWISTALDTVGTLHKVPLSFYLRVLFNTLPTGKTITYFAFSFPVLKLFNILELL